MNHGLRCNKTTHYLLFEKEYIDEYIEDLQTNYFSFVKSHVVCCHHNDT